MNATLQALHPVLASNDMAASIAFYGRLGFTLRFKDNPDDPKYAGVQRDGIEFHIQWAAADQWAPGIDRPTYRIRVSDVDALYDAFMRSGALDARSNLGSPWAKPADTPWRTREFHLRDPGHNGLQFYRPL
jgi:catechol 2,3-dioxygenase-like lactoylglutathione lyase family enzyme